MKYTLDSLKLVENCILSENRGRVVVTEQVILKISDLLEQKNDTFYYGVFYNGDNTSDTKVFYQDIELLNLVSNSQIIPLFTHVNNDDLANTKGLFYGHEIQLK